MSTPNLFPASLDGIGSIEICVADEPHHNRQLMFYRQLLNQQGTKEPGGTYSFDAGNTELRITRATLPANQAIALILYLRISDGKPDTLKALHQELKKKYREVLAPNGSSKDAKETWRSVLADGDGNQFGLVINPPYPRLHAERGLLWLGSVLGLVLGAGLASWLLPGLRSRR
jgi:hypothetical protein